MAPYQRTVNTIPSHDAVLRRVVDRLTRSQPPQSAQDLAEQLRPVFPRVAVFERQLSGEAPHLYVYRDGRYEPDRGKWWTAADVPCVHVSTTTGTLTSVTGSWASLMRADPADLVGRHFLEFVVPEARAAAQAMFEVVSEEREVRSEAVVVRADGSRVAIEFRAISIDGEIEVCYRPLESEVPRAS
jgi:PAS domain S-box-containing protein